MKLLVEVPEDKASFFLELLQQLPFVKSKKVGKEEEKFYEGLREAVEEVNQIKAGKKKGKPLVEFLNEL